MPYGLFRYRDKMVTAMEGPNGRRIVYWGSEPVAVIQWLAAKHWRDGKGRVSPTLAEAIYTVLQEADHARQ